MTNASGAPYGIRMVAFARHKDACKYVCEMTKYIRPLLLHVSWPATVTTTIVATKEQFIEEIQVTAALTIVSAHGPGLKDPFSPRIGDGTLENRIELRILKDRNLIRFGARAGMIWDACQAGRPEFRTEYARLSHPGIVHIGPLGEIFYPDSERIARTILDALLAPGSQPITPGAVSFAAARAADSVGIPVWHGTP